MAAAKLNLYVEQGASFKKVLKFSDSTGTAIDLTGKTYKGQIRKTTGAATAVADFAFTILDQVTNAGELEMKLTNIQTSAIPVTASKDAKRTNQFFAYDVECTNPDTTVERVLEGTVEVSPEATLI